MSNLISSDKVLFLDFDHTCYDTDAFLLHEIRQPMINKFKIPSEEWEKSYEKAVRAGYSVEQHMSELNKIMPHPQCSLKEIKKFGKTISFNKYLYPDVVFFLNEVRQKGYKIILLSFGAPAWQNKKVRGVGINKMVDEIIYTKTQGTKIGIIREYKDYQKIIFVENNGQDLDIVKNELPHVDTHYIKRHHDNLINKDDIEYMRIRYMESRKMAERPLLFLHKQHAGLKDITLE